MAAIDLLPRRDRRKATVRFFAPFAFLAAIVAALAVPANAAPASPFITADAVRRPDVFDLGRANGNQLVALTVTMKYRNEAELDRLVDLQGDPSSPLYRRFLSNQQFNAYFSPAVADYNRVDALLQRAGFAVLPSDNGTTIQLIGRASQVERYFRTEIHNVRQAGVRDVRYANVRPAIMPAEIADVADAAIGFDSLRGPTTDHTNPVDPGPIPDKLSGKTLGPHGGYSPFAIAQAYDYPVQHNFDGKGHAIAIAIDYDSSDTDLAAFQAYFGIKRTGKNHHIPVDGGQPYDPNGGSVESTLDTETVASMDPGADMYVYNFGASFTWKEITDAYNKIVADDKVEVASSSFGLCEDDVAKTVVSTIVKITKQGAAKGISFVASTGDFGRGGKCSNRTGQDVPAVTRFFTSVGGFDPTIDMNGKLLAETEDGGSGGGPSDIFKIPSYQVGLKGVFSKTKRNIPDVSGPYNPDAFYYNGQWGTVGGTSWAAPATAAFLVEENQVEGARIGFAKGYDDCSGIGALRAYRLAQSI
jgi:kumamolisin